jgi:uncharacterized membrane protein
VGWAIHMHLIAAIAWIGGAFFMFVLGVSLRRKEDQEAVYPRIGPIYGYFETMSLIILITTGIIMITNNGLIHLLFSNITNEVLEALRIKLTLVAVITVMTMIHMYISFKTLNTQKTPLERFLSKASSMGIFIINLVILHYAMVLRDIL